MKSQTSLKIAAVVGASGVAAGAFGAHGLEGRLSGELMEIYRTASLYHLLHAPVLLGISLFLGAAGPNRRLEAAFQLFFSGLFVFSGSLYTLSLTDVRWWGAVTPIGGTLLIAGWVVLAFVRFGEGKNADKPA